MAPDFKLALEFGGQFLLIITDIFQTFPYISIAFSSINNTYENYAYSFIIYYWYKQSPLQTNLKIFWSILGIKDYVVITILINKCNYVIKECFYWWRWICKK